jgi:hypothetical protein
MEKLVEPLAGGTARIEFVQGNSWHVCVSKKQCDRVTRSCQGVIPPSANDDRAQVQDGIPIDPQTNVARVGSELR